MPEFTGGRLHITDFGEPLVIGPVDGHIDLIAGPDPGYRMADFAGLFEPPGYCLRDPVPRFEGVISFSDRGMRPRDSISSLVARGRLTLEFLLDGASCTLDCRVIDHTYDHAHRVFLFAFRSVQDAVPVKEKVVPENDPFDPDELLMVLDLVKEAGLETQAAQIGELIVAEKYRREAIARCEGLIPGWIGSSLRIGSQNFRLTGFQIDNHRLGPNMVDGTDLALYLASDGAPFDDRAERELVDRVIRDLGLPAELVNPIRAPWTYTSLARRRDGDGR